MSKCKNNISSNPKLKKRQKTLEWHFDPEDRKSENDRGKHSSTKKRGNKSYTHRRPHA